MQELGAAACPASPSRLPANAVKPFHVSNSDVHSHSAFSNLSPCASPARDSSPKPDEQPAALPVWQQQQQQQLLSDARYALPPAGIHGVASERLNMALGAGCPAAMRSRSSGMTASTMVPTPHGAPRADPAAAAAAAAAAADACCYIARPAAAAAVFQAAYIGAGWQLLPATKHLAVWPCCCRRICLPQRCRAQLAVAADANKAHHHQLQLLKASAYAPQLLACCFMQHSAGAAAAAAAVLHA
uniref:Uncharacterized protein n=1 Tax=Tetradesmus obliquus TaxID=3088 RepID=A0A383VBX8_TETOB|eukprot:jgi/Sobl393_1/9669/SZX62443.1